MAKLAVNVDHVATVRQARRGREPDPVTAAALAELAGCDGIIVHLREDRRHICDRDVRVLRETVKTKLNLEMAAIDEIIGIAVDTKPDMCTLVPEKREELTTEGGLDVAGNKDHIKSAVTRLHEGGIIVSLFVEPSSDQIEASKEAGADIIEIHTGIYSNAQTDVKKQRDLENIIDSASLAVELGLGVNAGHGLDYYNIHPLVQVAEIDEFSIGHSIVARSVLVGMEMAVREMVELIKCR
jgi:pyridoxine 5-phosphate synthase